MDAKKLNDKNTSTLNIEFTDEPKSLESQIISEITVNTGYTPASARERFIDDYTFCPLCGDELLYVHNTHFVDLQVKEEAHCTSCKVRIKNADHALQ